MNEIIDTHSHLQFSDYDHDRDEVIKRTRAAGIICINVGCSLASSKSAVELAEKSEGFYAAIGLHPTDVDEEFDAQSYRSLAKSKKVVAIGEIGLDYLRNPNKERQRHVFLQQADLAQELNLPMVIHCRMAHEDMLEILKARSDKLKAGGVIHCFTGTLAQAQQYVALGFYLGINGIIFKFNIDEVIKNVPLEHLLLETDCPYLTPPMAPQKRNEPMFMRHTIKKIAELKNIDEANVENVTTQNAKKMFKI